MKAFFDDISFLFRPDERQRAIKKLSQENGWKFKSRRNYDADPIKNYGFQVFEGRSRKRLKSIGHFKVRALAGSFRLYDFHYFGDLNTKTTTLFEYYAEPIKLPQFSIQPKPGFQFFKKMFGEEDPVILTATPDFIEKYDIRTTDNFKLKENLTEEFLDRLGDEGQWAVEGNQSVVIYYQAGNQIPATKLLERLEVFVHLVYDLENGRTFIR